jgi:hypothetical protein
VCCKYALRADTATHEGATQSGVTWMSDLHLNLYNSHLTSRRLISVGRNTYMFVQILVYMFMRISLTYDPSRWPDPSYHHFTKILRFNVLLNLIFVRAVRCSWQSVF